MVQPGSAEPIRADFFSVGDFERMQTVASTRMSGAHLLDAAGHWVQQEQPEEVSKLLVQFLQGSQPPISVISERRLLLSSRSAQTRLEPLGPRTPIVKLVTRHKTHFVAKGIKKSAYDEVRIVDSRRKSCCATRIHYLRKIHGVG